MALDSSLEGELKILESVDENGSFPVSCSCLKLVESSSDEVKQLVPLEVPSILFQEASFSGELYQPLHSSLDQDLYSISVLPEEGDKADCASPLAFFSILQVPDQSESLMSLDAQINCHSCIDFQMKSEEVCSPCTVDIPTVNGNSISPEFHEEGFENFRTRNFLTRVLWRQASLKVGGKLMQILTNLTTSRTTSVTDKVHDLPSIRWRRYKRSASFDSRKVALLFSILSSVGTLVLIYLTLKVRQRSDGFVLL